MRRRKRLGLGFDQRDRDRLHAGLHLHAERVIATPFAAPARAAVDDFNRAGRFLAANKVRPGARMQRRIDELRPGIGFVECHRWTGLAAACLKNSSMAPVVCFVRALVLHPA